MDGPYQCRNTPRLGELAAYVGKCGIKGVERLTQYRAFHYRHLLSATPLLLPRHDAGGEIG